MRSSWTPSIVPSHADDQNVYLVIDDYGPAGRAYRETDLNETVRRSSRT